MRFALVIAAAIVSTAASASAATVAIDFDALASGTFTSFSEDGFTFDVSVTGGNANLAAAFDTTCIGAACNGDPDLVPVSGNGDVSGNVLIIQNNTGPTPNDDPQGGDIFLTLTAGQEFWWLGASAVDDGMFSFFDVNGGALLGSIALAGEGETGKVSFISSLIGIGDTIRISLNGSGGIDSLILQTIPIPAGLLLMLTGVGGLLLVGRRQSALVAI